MVVKSSLSSCCFQFACHLVSMNENTGLHGPLPQASAVTHDVEIHFGSHNYFPPLTSMKKGGDSSSNAAEVPLLVNNGNGNFLNHTSSGANIGKNGLPQKGKCVPYVNMFKENRMAKKDYKLDFVEPDDGMLKIGAEHVDSVEKIYCWNSYVLSRLASMIGKPIHMDMLTHDQKRVKFARVSSVY